MKEHELTPGAKYALSLQGTGLKIAVHFPSFIDVGDVEANTLEAEVQQAVAEVLSRHWKVEPPSKVAISESMMRRTLKSIEDMNVDVRLKGDAIEAGFEFVEAK